MGLRFVKWELMDGPRKIIIIIVWFNDKYCHRVTVVTVTVSDLTNCPSLWPSGIDSRLGRNRLWVRFLAVSDIYPMFIEPTITWVLRVLWVHMACHNNCVEKKKKIVIQTQKCETRTKRSLTKCSTTNGCQQTFQDETPWPVTLTVTLNLTLSPNLTPKIFM